MQPISRVVSSLITLLATATGHADGAFKKPTNDAEWKAFCQAPDHLKRVKAIQDKALQQMVASTCLRAPWQKFKPSSPKSY